MHGTKLEQQNHYVGILAAISVLMDRSTIETKRYERAIGFIYLKFAHRFYILFLYFHAPTQPQLIGIRFLVCDRVNDAREEKEDAK